MTSIEKHWWSFSNNNNTNATRSFVFFNLNCASGTIRRSINYRWNSFTDKNVACQYRHHPDVNPLGIYYSCDIEFNSCDAQPIVTSWEVLSFTKLLYLYNFHGRLNESAQCLAAVDLGGRTICQPKSKLSTLYYRQSRKSTCRHYMISINE